MKMNGIIRKIIGGSKCSLHPCGLQTAIEKPSSLGLYNCAVGATFLAGNVHITRRVISHIFNKLYFHSEIF